MTAARKMIDADWINKCPKCGGKVDTGEKKHNARLKCPTCKRRLRLHHVGSEGDCGPPFCYESSHWSLVAVVSRVRA